MNPTNQTDDLIVLEERATSRPDSIEDIYALISAYETQGRWDDAIKMYKAAIALNPASADLHNSLGTAYEEASNSEQAEKAYQQAIALQTDNPMAYYNLGSLYEEQQRKQEAIRMFEKCLRYSTDSDERSEIRKKLTSLLPERTDVIQMYKSIRGWAIYFLVGVGLLIFAGGRLDPVWGIVLIVSAVLSWRIKIPAMFVLYSVIMGWAAVTNGVSVLRGANLRWLVTVFIQVAFVVGLVREFRKYRHLPLQELFEAGTWPAHHAPPQSEAVITSRFAIVGVILAVSAMILLPGVFVGTMALATMMETSQVSQLMVWLLSGTIDVGVLAMGLSCAALLSRNNKRGWAISGVVISAVVLIGWLGLSIVTNLK